MKILLVEDEADVAELVRVGLVANSHTVEISADGADGSFLARSFDYDAVILDYSLPRKDGLAICKDIRIAGKSTPIVFLSGTESSDVKVAALDSGADDFIVKPFSMAELNSRLKALARRPADIKRSILELHDVRLDLDNFTVFRAEKRVRLTRKEFNLLEYLMRAPGAVRSRALLLEHVWSAESDPFSNTVEAHIRNLRKKLNAGGLTDLIRNIPGRGYIMDTPKNLAEI